MNIERKKEKKAKKNKHLFKKSGKKPALSLLPLLHVPMNYNNIFVAIPTIVTFMIRNNIIMKLFSNSSTVVIMIIIMVVTVIGIITVTAIITRKIIYLFNFCWVMLH